MYNSFCLTHWAIMGLQRILVPVALHILCSCQHTRRALRNNTSTQRQCLTEQFKCPCKMGSLFPLWMKPVNFIYWAQNWMQKFYL